MWECMHVDTKSQCPVYAYMYLLCEYAYMWIPEVSVQYLLPSMSTLPFETEFLLNLDLTDFARLIDLQTSWFIFFSPFQCFPRVRITDVCCHAQCLYVGGGDGTGVLYLTQVHYQLNQSSADHFLSTSWFCPTFLQEWRGQRAKNAKWRVLCLLIMNSR